MNDFFKKLFQRKALVAFVIIAIVAAGYLVYKSYSSTAPASNYVLTTVKKGTLIVDVSGTGQVSTSNQIIIKSQASSGSATYIGASNGQYVGAGALLVEVDPTNAKKAVRDTQINLDSANLALQQLEQSSANISQLTDSAFNSISSAFLDLPTIMNGATVIIAGNTLAQNESNFGYYEGFVYSYDQDQVLPFATKANSDYLYALNLYNQNLSDYQNASRFADSTTTINLLNETVTTTKALGQALQSEQNLLDFLNDYSANHTGRTLPTLITTYRSNLQTYIGQVNSHITDLTNVQNNLSNAPLNIASQQLSIKQKENALQDAKDNLAYSYIRAPFDGIVANINVTKDTQVNPGDIVATFITTQKLAVVTLNEVDAAKIKLGQQATVTFDAIPDLSISGKVTQIDTIGTVTQGVVNYNVQIAFDTQDNRVKPGMSVNVAIITDTKQNVLLVPNSAVKTQGGIHYVQVVSEGNRQGSTTSQAAASAIIPVQQQVEVGLSNDSMTEITSGLKEGDTVVARTVSSTSSTQAQSQGTGGLRIPGIGGGGFRGN